MSGLKDDWEDRLDGYIKGVHELEAKVGNVTRGWFLGGKRARGYLLGSRPGLNSAAARR